VSAPGVVVGYRAEARCLANDLRVLCSGADPERARAAAGRLRDEGVAGLVSFGLAGGLVADLAPGDLLLPQAVILPDGGRLATEAAWRDQLVATLRRAGLEVRGEPIAGSGAIVATAAAKRALAARTGAVAVDMESHAVGEVAARAGLPFLIVRAIADRSDQPIPRTAQAAIDAQGGIRHLALLGGLIGRPWEISALIGLGRSSGRGLATLRRVAVLAPGLGFA
jgi:adenosylhomocysteine nucleosidase